jgi:hypothetical protein
MSTGNRQLDLSSIPKIITGDSKPKFVRRLNAVYWDARRMQDNFVRYDGKVRNSTFLRLKPL